MTIRDDIIDRWWPATQSFDLVEATPQSAAQAIQTEVSRFVGKEELIAGWEEVPHFDRALNLASEFAGVPTFYLVIPTVSAWSVVWTNSSLCDGYDSLCWCLSQNHSLRTVHWSAHDTETTFQPGACFVHRRREGESLVERSVYVRCEDGRWYFQEDGLALPEEDIVGYSVHLKRERLNEQRVIEFLRRLGADPWSSKFYDFRTPVFTLRRPKPPKTVPRFPITRVVQRANWCAAVDKNAAVKVS